MTFDFSSQQLFRNPTQPLHTPATRGFKSTERKSIQTQISIFKKQILQKLISQVSTQVDMMVPIQCLKNKHPNIKIPTTTEAWNTRCTAIQKTIKEMEQNATPLHIEEQHKLLHQAKIKGDKPTIKAIQQKLNAEKTAIVYQ